MPLPRGVDIWADLGKWLRRFKIQTAFDVGANAGQSALDIVRHHLPCSVWCFEPVPETYCALQQRMQS